MRKSLFLSSAALLALAGAAKADDLLPETVVVTATRLPTPVDQVGSSVTLITAAEIDNRQQRTLPDVLQTVPGLNIVQTGGVGGVSAVFMRGTESRHTKVLVDGIDIADPASPNDAADLSKIFTGDIARVEVLRGPQSGVYGSDAVGGVINVITQAGEGAPRFTAQAEGGSFDTFNQRAGVSGSEGGFHYALSLDHVHAGATPVTPLNLLPPGQKRNDDYYDGLTGSARLGLDVTDNFDLSLVTRYVDSVARVTNDAFLSVPPYSSAPSAFQTRLGTLQYQTRATAHLSLWDGRFDQTLGFAYNSTVSRSLDPDNGNALGTGHRTKLDWQGDIKLDAGETLVLGAESERERLRVAQASGFTYNLKAGTTTNAGYAELQSVLGDFGNSLNLRYDDNSRFGSKLTYRVAPTYTIAATGTRLKASIGSAFKPPSLEQLYGPYSHNVLLKPETSTGYDAGFEQDLGPVTAGVTWFRNDIKNLIAYGPAPAFALANIGRAMTQGVESFAAWKVGDSLSLRADYTYTDATDEGLHQELARRPRNKASLTADWQPTPELMLDATLLVTGPQIDGNRDFSIPRLKLAGYTVLNLAASYRLTDGFTLFGRVENATDTQYQSPDGFLRPRLGAFAGVKAAF